ncbi:MAG: carboxypeptidase regulatory-like domain-containing protein [Acidobacteria bacterium]|nr:carboxypeptidase regulatory-like domain-containing protein [Acidobacteriota bacterium]
MSPRLYDLAVLCVAILGGKAFGQITGDLQVLVSDPTQAVVVNAEVSIVHKETALGRKLGSGITGGARFSQLPLGSYQVKVEARGFANYTANALVSSGAVTTVKAQLEVQSTKQEVNVTESTPAVNMLNAQLQTTVEAPEIVTLPIARTGVLGLAAVAPGVVPVSPRNPFLGIGSFNSNGGRGRGNNITIDNATATDTGVTGVAGLGTVPLDGIREFSLVTNTFSAEFGRNSSAQAQVLTKSGSNEFHGRLFEFFRNDKLNSRDYFDRTGLTSPHRDNNWGAVAGGRLVRDKLFWFGTYEQQRTGGEGGTRLAQVPRPDQVTGITDPTSKDLLAKMNVPTDPSGTISNRAANVVDTLAFSGRVDANLTARDTLSGRYGIEKLDEQSPSLAFVGSSLAAGGITSSDKAQNATATYTRTFGASAVNQLLASFGRTRPSFDALSSFAGPEIVFNGGSIATLGVWNSWPQGRAQTTYELMDTLSYVRGRHQVKAGADLNRVHLNSFYDLMVRGQFVFLNFNDFAAGTPFSYTQRFGNSVRGNRVSNQFFFVQDDVRVARHLTLNIGMRLEVNGGVNEVNGLLSNLDLQGTQAMGDLGTGPLGSIYKGGTYFNRTSNWGPRFGFAYNPHGGKLSIRGGYGIAYDFIYLNPILNGRFLPPLMYQGSLTQAQIGGADNYAALVSGTSAFQRNWQSTVGSYPTGWKNIGALSPIDVGLRNPQVHQFSFSVERELPGQWVGRVSYSGAKGNYLQRSAPVNTARPGQFTPPETLAEQTRRQQAGEFSALNTALNGTSARASSRLDPRFNGVSLLTSSANSNYHSVQFTAERRFSRGYLVRAAYTIAKSIDDVSDALNVLANDSSAQQNPFDNRNNRAVSQFDVPQRLSLVHVYSPQVRTGSAIARHVLNGWTLSGILQLQGGFPVNIMNGSVAGLADGTLIGGSGTLRPNLVGPLNVEFAPNPGLGTANPNKVTASGLESPLVGHFGTLGRNVLRTNGLVQSDVTVAKRVRLSERLSTEFQTQVYNVFNNTSFSRPGLSRGTASTFGYYADTYSDSRNMTMALRLIW